MDDTTDIQSNLLRNVAPRRQATGKCKSTMTNSGSNLEYLTFKNPSIRSNQVLPMTSHSHRPIIADHRLGSPRISSNTREALPLAGRGRGKPRCMMGPKPGLTSDAVMNQVAKPTHNSPNQQGRVGRPSCMTANIRINGVFPQKVKRKFDPDISCDTAKCYVVAS